MKVEVNRVPTGIKELDSMLRGGFVAGDCVLLAGAAGTGKSTLALQYIVNGIKNYDESGIYVTFEELPDQIYRDAANFGWDLKKFEKQNKLRIICTSPNVLLEQGGEVIIGDAINEIGARRIVIDSMSHLAMYVSENDLRKEAYRLIMYLKARGTSQILTWEASQIFGQSFAVTEVGMSFLVDAIVLLRFVEIESEMRKTITILKMRGSDHDRSLREYRITSNGIEVSSPLHGFEGVVTGIPRRAQEVSERLEKWLEEQPQVLKDESLEELCTSILKVRGVRYAAVRDSFGNVVAGGQKKGVREIETAEERKESSIRVSLMSGLFGLSPPSFGKPEFLWLRYEKIIMGATPIGGGKVLLVTLNPEAGKDASSKVESITRHAILKGIWKPASRQVM